MDMMSRAMTVAISDSDSDEGGRSMTMTTANEPSDLHVLLQNVQDAAARGNLTLVNDRCQEILELCSLLAFKQSRKSGGLQYRPEYLLQSVLLADRL